MISIIVPVHNSAKHLNKCVESIVSQTRSDWELILIDDGSTDDSPAMCDRFAANDCRIKVAHQANSGVSAARNRGLELSQGEYATFIDSDDWVAPTLLEELYRSITDSGSDIAIGGAQFDNENEPRTVVAGTTFTLTPDNTPKFLELETSKLIFSVWGKLYRTQIIRDNNLAFSHDTSSGEDLIFNFAYLRNVKRISTTTAPLYFYRADPTSNSLSTKRRSDYYEINYSQWKLTKKFHNDMGLLSPEVTEMLNERLWGLIGNSIYLITKFNDSWDKKTQIAHLKKALATPEISNRDFRRHNFRVSRWIRFVILHRQARLFYIAMKLKNIFKKFYS